jgi:hypothetical protein
MNNTTAIIDDDDIEISSATQSVEELQASLGIKPAAAPTGDKNEPPPAGGEGVAEAEAAAAAGDGNDDENVDDDAEQPKPGETAEQKQQREERNKTRGERRLETFDQRIAAKRKELGDLDRAIEQRKKGGDQAAVQGDKPAPAGDKPAQADKPAAQPPAAAVAPKTGAVTADELKQLGLQPFAFPDYETWQQQPGNEDKDANDYSDARTDARYAFNSDVTAARERVARAEARAIEVTRTYTTALADFKRTHPDFDTVLDAATHGFPEGHPVKELTERACLEAGALGPAIYYHLAQHPDAVDALMASTTVADFGRRFGRLEAKVEDALNAAPAGDGKKPAAAAAAGDTRRPSKPRTDAPAPATQVGGPGSTPRTATQIGNDDDEDADEYIGKIAPHLLKGR